MKQTLIYTLIALVLVIIAAIIAFVFVGPAGNGGTGDGERPGFFSSLFPFNGSGDGNEPLFVGDAPPKREDNRPVPRLRQLSAKPVSGGVVFDNDDGSVGFRFVERETGHIYEAFADRLETKRVTNTTIPGIQEVVWINKNELIVRYDDGGIENFYIELVDAESEQSVNGSFLDSWHRAALDPSGESLFTVTETQNGSRLALSSPDGETNTTLLNSPIKSWVPLQSERDVYVQSAPASGVSGFLYELQGGALVKVFGDGAGLMANVNPSGTYALISTGAENDLELAGVSLASKELFPAPIVTIASKCAWSGPGAAVCGIPNNLPAGEYPNDWLLGRVSFSDTLWELDVEGSAGALLADLESEARSAIDVWQPRINSSGTHVIFMNKNDLSLWSYELREAVVEETEEEN